MGFYRRYLFPRLCDAGLRGPASSRLREEAVKRLSGDVIEIGVGSGLNIPRYATPVRSVVGIDSNAGMLRLAKEKVDEATVRVTLRRADAHRLPFDDGSFDCALSTWTLCSIPRPVEALREIGRVLRPGGRLVFVEHGASEERGLRRWQRRLNWLQRRVADGCELDRDPVALLVAAGFEVGPVERGQVEGFPRLYGYTYRGVAVREE